MKKKVICMLTVIFLSMGSVNAFAEDIAEVVQENLLEKYSTEITIPTTDREYLSLEDATKKTLNNSTNLKTTANSIASLETQLDNAAYGFTYNNEDGISALITLVNTQVSLKNSLISQNTTNESLKYSLKQTYVDIIVAERNIALSKENLKTAEKNLNIAKIKNRMGTLSDIELKEQQLSYDQSVLSLEQQEISLEANYISLNILMGVDVNNRYSFDLSLEYEPLELAVSIESYMTAKVAVHPSVIKAQNSLQLATDNFNLNMSVGNSSNYTTMKNNIATAGFNLEDTKDSVSQSIRTLYNTIIQREKSIDTSLIELETLKEKLETTKLKYEAGMASENEFLTAKQNVANKEYSIISNLYSHMLEVEKFNNPDLI